MNYKDELIKSFFKNTTYLQILIFCEKKRLFEEIEETQKYTTQGLNKKLQFLKVHGLLEKHPLISRKSKNKIYNYSYQTTQTGQEIIKVLEEE